jgi:hypothetical protein
MMRMTGTRAAFACWAVTLVACNVRSAAPVVAKPPVATEAPPPAPKLLTSADVDARLGEVWARAGITPAAPADDATWLRRVWLDTVGTIPPAEAVRRFVVECAADSSQPGTRARARERVLDELLASPAWADHWTAYFDELWMGHDGHDPLVDPGAFRSWLHDGFARNRPYSEMVTELLTATGLNSDGGPRRQAEKNDGSQPAPEGVNGAVNWTLRYLTTPQDMAGAASRTLLGVQIQCAQCHDHKTEKWTQRDFQSFAAAFVRTRLDPLDTGKAMGEVKRAEVHDLDRVAPRFGKMGDFAPIAAAKPAALDGADLGGGTGVRAALAHWVTAPENPWFSRAIANRVWAHFLGRGFVDPVDDFRVSNPPVAPELLDAIAADFVKSGYDFKHLVRVVAGTRAYALSAAPLSEASARVDPEGKLWQRFRVAPLGPDELLRAIVAATRLDAIVRSTGRLDLADVRYRMKQRYGFLFDVDEESAEPDYEGTIAQALALLNGSLVATGASDLPGSALADVLAMPGDAPQDAARVEALYLRVLSRLPTPEETARVVAYLSEAQQPPGGRADSTSAPPLRSAPPPAAPAPMVADTTPARKKAPQKNVKAPAPDPLRGLADRAGNAPASARVRAWEDILWAMLNSSEFVLNH